MPKNKDEIYGSKLTRKELEPLLPEKTPVPFVFVYSCAIKTDLTQDGLYETILAAKKRIPDFKNVMNNNSGTEYDSIIVEFTRRQWALEFAYKGDEVWVQLSFGTRGKPWGSNYALWLLHQRWILEETGAVKVRDLMDHVDPVDVNMPS